MVKKWTDEKKSLKFTSLLLGIDIDLFAGVADPSHVIMVCDQNPQIVRVCIDRFRVCSLREK
jgi:hypothetical protein